MKIVNYETVEEPEVADYLARGWELYGNPFMDGYIHYQAMILREGVKGG